ncbi:MAG: hypothetical protein L3J43_03945 [Sulfurovum sp.]|nr:hypothetical protein [Sulfurovum sp.]
MNELVFQVEFLSDIVLPATSNTEGNIEQLDFIPGSNFLGMAAREYATFTDSFSVFHSGAVRFGDASLVEGSKITYKMPLSFFHEKLDDTLIFNHHLIEDFSRFKQLKQKRKGYITKDFKAFSVKHNYTQKSAYDKGNRRSKEGSMFGYQSIPAGTLWQFSIRYDTHIENADIEKIQKSLLGKRRLGKSKSAQYGSVQITSIQKAEEVECSKASGETVMLYAKSRLALVDEGGMATYNLIYLTEGLKDENIVWEKSQIKTSTFTPYNGAMQTKSYERVVINAGSVIVLKNVSSAQLKNIEKGVGAYLSEGFGELLINPAFLSKEGGFSLFSEQNNPVDNKVKIDDAMVQFLANRKLAKKEDITLASKASDFIAQHRSLYKNISNAQWGNIRSICTSPGESFREDIRDYIESGKVTWSNQQIETLLEEDKSKMFIKMISMQMPKAKKEN